MPQLKPKPPSYGGLVFSATSGLILGALLAVVALLATQPRRLSPSELEEGVELRPGDYQTAYAPGQGGLSNSPNFRRRMQRFLQKQPGPLMFSERDINGFLGDFAIEAPEGEGDRPEPYRASSPVARLSEGRFELSVKATINPTTNPFDLVVRILGRLEPSESGPAFRFEKLYLNSLPLPGFVARNLIHASLEKQPLDPRLVEAWEAAREAEITDGALAVVVGRS